MILFFDTETTGFPHKHKPLDHPDQPHIVELAAELCQPDGRPVANMSLIIDPGVEKGIHIPSKVAEIHGIDDEKAWRLGVEPKAALGMFLQLLQRADTVVAHNLAFDEDIFMCAVARHLPYSDVRIDGRERFCTMRETTDICRLPPTRSVTTGQGGYKWPKLSEAYKHFFGEELVGAHSAGADTAACRRIYFHLKDGFGAVAPPKAEEW